MALLRAIFYERQRNVSRETTVFILRFRKNDSDLSTQARPYRLAGSALPSEFGGS